MRIEGYGGRGGNHENETLAVLKGLLPEDEALEIWDVYPLPAKHCANRKCGKLFTPRADGDDYCSEVCDLAANPQFKAGHSGSHLDDTDDPGKFYRGRK